LDSLITKLRRIGRLSDAEIEAVRDWDVSEQRLSSRRSIVKEGDLTNRCAVLLEGIVCRSKQHASGERQIVSFHFPGDMLDLQHLLFEKADHSVEAVSACRIAWVTYQQIRDTMRRSPALVEAFWRDTLLDASIFREWVLNVGRRDAVERIAHLLCELRERMIVSGIDGCKSPDFLLTQEHLADVTGLTPVHVNRMIGQLRQVDALPARGQDMTKVHMVKLRAICAFDTSYLHQLAS
jgi:CRP-like cAMP-binding protein